MKTGALMAAPVPDSARRMASESIRKRRRTLRGAGDGKVNHSSPRALARSSRRRLFILLLFSAGAAPPARGSSPPYADCDVAAYYSSLPTAYPPSAALSSHLRTTHRSVVPYTSTAPDVWDALIDLDSDPTGATVRLMYRDVYVNATPHGGATNWNREHLWPKSHGVGYEGPDFTDLHALRPADWNVNAARNNRFFGPCGVARPTEFCVRPAHAEAAADTERDAEAFLPPAGRRGDVARSLFYMALRYDGEGPDEYDLKLSDCPNLSDHTMGYLSQLLRWHVEDPVDDAERTRNDGVCRDWQGNRNPFVDFPDLVPYYFGMPRESTLGDGMGYDCSVPNPPGPDPPSIAPSVSLSPTTASSATQVIPATATGGTCKGLNPGDVVFTGFKSDNPDTVVMAALTEIPDGAILYLTDNAWTGTEFKSNEGTKKLTTNVAIPSGSIFGYTGGVPDPSVPLSDAWETESGTFALSSTSDAIFLYCLDDGPTGPSLPVHIAALTYATSGWSDSGVPADFATGESAFPVQAALVVVELPHRDNYRYAGPRSGFRNDLRSFASDPSNWVGSDDPEFDVASSQDSFAIDTSAPSSFPTASDLGTCGGMDPGDVMIGGFNSVDPDEVALVALKDLPEGGVVFLTDNAWDGSAFRTNEGVKKLVIPVGGIPSGTVFGYGDPSLSHSNAWQSVSGSLRLSSASDNLFLYCLDVDGSTPRPLTGLTYSTSGWSASGEPSYATSETALPASLPPNCAVELRHENNYVYVGTKSGTPDAVRNAMSDEAHWVGSNVARHNLPLTLGQFNILP